MAELYIGLMSGTSIDGIDAALVDFSRSSPQLIATHYTSYPVSLRTEIMDLCQKGDNEIERLGELDIKLGKAFAEAVNTLLSQQSLKPHDIKAIGSHGQTIRHRPQYAHPFSLQAGDPNTIAVKTGITTVADFRRKDIAQGGQGAPLVPAFHQSVFISAQKTRVIANIGGIANVTFLFPDAASVLGFDTGPGNILLDSWIQLHQKKNHDQYGEWSAAGNCHHELLEKMLSDPYFKLQPPKSTGREYFNLEWIQTVLKSFENKISAIDLQTTLVELTAQSLLNAIRSHITHGEILICGGGVHNAFMMKRLTELAQPAFTVSSTLAHGIDPDWVEAIAFAWLARQTLNQQSGNLPSVTGATKASILGGIYLA